MSSSQHLSSQSQSESIRQQYKLQCRVCKSYNFDEDDETGFMVCNDCGAQLLEYTQESFALDDGNVGTTIQGRLNLKKLYTRNRKNINIDDNTNVKFNIDLKEFLSAYQYALKLLTEKLSLIIDLCNSNELLEKVKSLWFSYLHSFRRNNINMATLLLHNNSNNEVIFKYLPPSGTLLLGFLYFACRILRLWITPVDLVKWCSQGVLPYYRLLNYLPNDIKSKLIDNSKFIFRLEVLSPTLIFYHTVKISEIIGITIPQLNAPLIAKTYILGLGLPKEVWEIYVKISCLFTDADPFIGMESWNEHYAENIMAAIIISCKFCRWTQWSIAIIEEAVKTKYSNFNQSNIRIHGNNNKTISINKNEMIKPISIPQSITELDNITRNEIPSLLKKIMLILNSNNENSKVSNNNININNKKKKRIDKNRNQYNYFRGIKYKGKDIFNDAVKSLLGITYKNFGNSELTLRMIFESNTNGDNSSNCFSLPIKYCNDAQICPIILNGGQIHNSNMIPELSKGNITKVNAIKKVKLLNNIDLIRNKEIAPYLLYVNDNAIPGNINDNNIDVNIFKNSSSTEGHFHVQYLVILERFARYLRTSPNLLHKLVDKYERQIYDLIEPFNINKSKAINISKKNEEIYDSKSFFPSFTNSKINTNNIEFTDGFNFNNSIRVMPFLKQLGMNILYKDDGNNNSDESSSSSDSEN